MKSWIERDKKRRLLSSKYELKRIQYKSTFYTYSLPQQVRWQASYNLSKCPKNSSPIRTKNRCILTGRSKSVDRIFKISRILFRQLALQGLLPGIRKASW
jgi:small subunit ribosomal protein S14